MGKNVNINAKNTGDKLTASEFNQVLDALNGDFSELSGTTWDGTNKYTTLTANTALTLTTTRNNGILKVVQDGTGSRTLTVNGQSLTIGTAASAVSFVYFINVAGTNHLFVELPAGSTAGAEPGNITPAAPTAGTVNDTLDTFDFTYTPGYTTVSEYEYTLDGGTTVSDLTAKPLSVGNVAKSAGQVGVRVKAATGRNASAWLFNAQPFTSDKNTIFNNQVNLTNTTGVWSTSVGAWGGYGVQDNKKLPASTAGRLYMKVGAADAINSALGLKTSSTLQNKDAFSFGFYFQDNGKLAVINGGTASELTTSVPAVGVWVGMYRDVAGNLKLQSSTDETTWTDIYTYPGTSAADLWAVSNLYSTAGKLYNPKGEGFV